MPILAANPANAQEVNDALNARLLLAGGNMQGPLYLSANAVSALQAVPLQQLNTALSGVVGGAYVGDTPPPSPSQGMLWWCSLPGSGQLFLNYNDVDGSQWVIANQGGVADAPADLGTYGRYMQSWVPVLPTSGGTMTGPLTLSANAASALQPVTLQQMNSTVGAYLPLSGGTLTGGLAMNIAGAAWASFSLTAPLGQGRQVIGYAGANPRWGIQLGNGSNESGSNAGNDFAITRYADGGGYLDAVIFIARSSGLVSFSQNIYTAGYTQVGSYLYANNLTYFMYAQVSDFYMSRYSDGTNTHRYLNFANNWYLGWRESDGIFHFNTPSGMYVWYLSGGGTTYQSGDVNAVNIYGNLHKSNTGRFVSVNSNNNPSCCVWDSNQGWAAGMFLGSGSLYFGNMDGSGNYVGPWYGRFDSSGNFWSNAATTATYLHSTGNIQIDGTGTVNGVWYVSGSYIQCQSGCTGVRYGSGSYSTNNTFLFGWSNTVSGLATLSVDNGGAVYAVASYSDARLKDEITPAQRDCLEVVKKLPLREYRVRDIPDPHQLKEARTRGDLPRRLGLIAQEIHKLYPEGVWEGDDFEDKLGRVWTLDQNNMIALLVGAVQQLAAKLEARA